MSRNRESRMSRNQVGPEQTTENQDELKVLSSTSIDKQFERLEAFKKKFDESPMANVFDVFKAGLKISASRPCLGSRTDINAPFTWLTYQEVFMQAINVGSYLSTVLKLGRNSFVGIYSKNRPEWVIMELGCFLFSLVPVPLYDTLSPESTDFIIQQTGMTTIMCESEQNVTSLLRLKGASKLKYIIQLTGRMPKIGETKQQVWSWQEVLKAGRENPAELGHQPNRNSVALLCYTSGTTGLPKGAQITHGNLIAVGMGMCEFLVAYGKNYISPPSSDDAYLSYLPLAHIFERIMHIVCFMQGMRIGFYRGDILTLVEDMKELKPTIFCTVPRLLNRIYDKTMAYVTSNCLRAVIFRTALRRKTDEVNRGIIRKNSIWDSLVFRKIQESTGNRIRLVIVGSAPIAEEVVHFTRAAFGCPVLEGYGQTESTGGSTGSLPGNSLTGNVGIPLFCNVIQLQDVPEMDYFAKDGCGEVCIKGLGVFTGYYGMEAETAKAITPDGWLHTGDIGQWTADGFLKLIDRKKHIFKLSQGLYIAPEKIEQIYCKNPYVCQVFVHGDSLQSFILGVVVPNAEKLKVWAKDHGVSENMKELCGNYNLKTDILSSLLSTGKANNLSSFEQVKDIFLHPEPFSIENGLLTPTFKAKRIQLLKLFRDQLTRMYQELNASSQAYVTRSC